MSLVRSAAVELGPANIRVNAVAPGVVWTPRVSAFLGEAGRERNADERAARARRPAADIAAALLFLASDLASYVTGQTLDRRRRRQRQVRLSAPRRRLTPDGDAGAQVLSSAWRRSSTMSAACSRPHDTRTVPGVMPAAASSSGSRPAWVVDAGWVISVSGPPIDVAGRHRATASTHRRPGGEAAGELEREHPAGEAHLARGQVVLRVRLEAGVAHLGHRRMRLQRPADGAARSRSAAAAGARACAGRAAR